RCETPASRVPASQRQVPAHDPAPPAGRPRWEAAARCAIRRARRRGRHGTAERRRVIVGIGADSTDIRRLEKTVERFGDRFIHRVFTEIEQSRSERRRNRVASYAKRWGAKEACSKALGTGLRMGVAWREMGVVNMNS